MAPLGFDPDHKRGAGTWLLYLGQLKHRPGILDSEAKKLVLHNAPKIIFTIVSRNEWEEVKVRYGCPAHNVR